MVWQRSMRPHIARRLGAWFGFFLLVVTTFACGGRERPLAPRSQAGAELRTVRHAVLVTLPDETTFATVEPLIMPKRLDETTATLAGPPR